MEEWKDVLGYEGTYQVSNLGRIKSISTNRSIHGKIIKIERDRMIIPHDNSKGYMYVTLQINKQKRNFYVHRLVAASFIGNENNLPEVNHIDRNKQNNASYNLEWVTRLENVNHSVCNMRKPRINSKQHKYIRQRFGKYEVDIPGFKYGGRFELISDAIEKRDLIAKEYYCR